MKYDHDLSRLTFCEMRMIDDEGHWTMTKTKKKTVVVEEVVVVL